jgi:HEAT repeat protein
MHAPNWEVRRTAAFLLREFGGSEGLRELQPLLTDAEPLVQREAIQALVLSGSEAASHILVSGLNATSGRPRESLLNELISMRDERAGPLFCHLIRQLDRRKFPVLYASAIGVLGSTNIPEAVEALKDVLRQGDWWAPLRTRRTRAAAARALRLIGTPAALDALRDASARGSWGVRSAARAELGQVG